MPETAYTMQLWGLVGNQINCSFGGPVGLNLGSIAQVFQIIGVQDIERQLRKMNAIYDHFYGKEKNDG